MESGEAAARPRDHRARLRWLAYYLGEDPLGGEHWRSHQSNAQLASTVEAGFSTTAAEFLRRRTGMSVRSFGQIIPRSTLQSKRMRADTKLSPRQSDRVMQVAALYAHAAEVFGSSEHAVKWMKRTNPQMPGERTPEEMTGTSYGLCVVDDALTRVEHGVVP